MKITTHDTGGSVIITLHGDFISETDQLAFRDRVKALAAKGQSHLIIDLKHVKYMNSCGLGSLICALTTVRKAGGDLQLASVGPDVSEILRITQLDTIFEIHTSVTE